jgi:hypothetical protein
MTSTGIKESIELLSSPKKTPSLFFSRIWATHSLSP